MSTSVELAVTQFPDKANMKFVSQSTSGVSRVLQNLFKYFNNTAFVLPSSEILPITAISTYFVLPSSEILPVILVYNLNDSESAIVVFNSSL